MCKFENNVEYMSFENCNLFKRSFTTQGIGYTFNNEIQQKLLKKPFRNTIFSPNTVRKPSMMKSASSENSLTAIIENNYENTKTLLDEGREQSEYETTRVVHKPEKILVSLHNPSEPPDPIFKPSTGIEIPLGHSTTFLGSAS